MTNWDFSKPNISSFYSKARMPIEENCLEEDMDAELAVCRLGKSKDTEEGMDEEPAVCRLGKSEILEDDSKSKRIQANTADDFNTDEFVFDGEWPSKKKHKKNKRRKYHQYPEMESNDLPIMDKHEKTSPAKAKSDNKKAKVSFGETEIDMRAVERYILEAVVIRRIHDKLYYYDGRIYRPLSKEKFLLLLRSRLPSKIEKLIPSFNKMEEVYKYLEVNPGIQMKTTVETENFVRHSIVFSNCIYNVEYNKVCDFSMEYPFLYNVNAKYIPKGEECRTPDFDSFIERVSNGNKKTKELILQMIGYVAMHSMEAKCFFLLGTAPNSGKSLLGEFIAHLFDEEFVGTVPLTELGRRFALGGLWKHVVNVSMDLPTRSLTEQEVSQIKTITGEKRVNTEKKYEPVGTTYLHCKCIYASNGRISLKIHDRAFWDRLVFVPFLHSIPKAEQDKNLLEKLLAEQDDIVSKAAYAARKLIKNNFIFDIPKEASDILDEWCLENNDSFTRFLENKCMTGYEYSVSSRILYDEYKVFCSQNHIQPESQTLLSRRISELPGVHKIKKRLQKDENPVWVFEGIGIADRV